MQLRQAKPLGVFNDHQASIGHVYADLNDGCGYQQRQFSAFERGHYRGLFQRFEPAVN